MTIEELKKLHPRKKVSDKEDVTYLLSGKIEAIIVKLRMLQDRGHTEIHQGYGYTNDYDNNMSYYLYVENFRLETDKEYEQRIKEIKEREEDIDHRRFLELKKKYENK